MWFSIDKNWVALFFPVQPIYLSTHSAVTTALNIECITSCAAVLTECLKSFMSWKLNRSFINKQWRQSGSGKRCGRLLNCWTHAGPNTISARRWWHHIVNCYGKYASPFFIRRLRREDLCVDGGHCRCPVSSAFSALLLNSLTNGVLSSSFIIHYIDFSEQFQLDSNLWLTPER